MADKIRKILERIESSNELGGPKPRRIVKATFLCRTRRCKPLRHGGRGNTDTNRFAITEGKSCDLSRISSGRATTTAAPYSSCSIYIGCVACSRGSVAVLGKAAARGATIIHNNAIPASEESAGDGESEESESPKKSREATPEKTESSEDSD